MKSARKTFTLKIAFIFIVSLICVIPLIYVFVGSTHDSSYIFNPSYITKIGNNIKNNYYEIIDNFNLIRVFINSIFIALINSIAGIFLIFLSAYAFAMYDFKGKKIIFTVLLISMLIPGNIIIINKFRLISDLNLKNSYLSLILPNIINIHILLLMMKNLEYINIETLEAARIDGSGEFRIMLKIGLPSVKGYMFIGFFSLFVHSWNNYLLPLLVINTKDLFTLPLLISSMSDPLRFKYGAVFLSLAILSLPIILLLLFLSKYIFRRIN